MRRTLALLALLATSWPHVVVLECALGSGGPAMGHEAGEHGAVSPAGTQPRTAQHAHGRSPQGAHRHHGGGDAHHAGDHTGHRAEPPSDGPLGSPQCAMVMACGLVMIRAGDDVAEEVAPKATGDATVRTLSSPTAEEPSADPPPPRLNA